MRVDKQASDILGTVSVFCDVCAREISCVENRRSCRTCKKDYCENCRACQMDGHKLVLYRGFPRTSVSRKSLIYATTKHLDKLFDQLFEDDNIYLVGWLRTIREVIASAGEWDGAVPVTASPEIVKGSARRMATLLWMLENGETYLRDWISLHQMGRFVDYFDRRAFAGRMPNITAFMHSQGGLAPLKWRGAPMMKTVWDFALASIMIQEIRPATVIEFGTANGASAVLYADLQSLHDLERNVFTIDRLGRDCSHGGIEFLRGESERVEQCLPPSLLERLPHPWLIFEDTHCNLDGILHYLHQHLAVGDYLVIEDVDAEDILTSFLSDHNDAYRVDTRYTDYFGHNATCAADQIICRV